MAIAALNPYLNFMGTTEAAFTFYQSVFGGAFAALQRFNETPEASKLSAEDGKKIMHIALPVGKNLLMGTDTLEAMGHRLQTGTNVSISIDADNEAEGRKLVDRLAEGGTVTVPFEKMFWGAWFGMLTDKFGIQWMVNVAEGQ